MIDNGPYGRLVEGLAEASVDEQLAEQLVAVRAKRCRVLDAVLFFTASQEPVHPDILRDAKVLQMEEDSLARQLGVPGPMLHPLLDQTMGNA
jgi:hypothetical protein